jgi:hypothetical protein
MTRYRARYSEDHNPKVNLSQRSESQGNKRAIAILKGKLSPLGFLIRNHRRRIAELDQQGTAPLVNHPIRPDEPAETFREVVSRRQSMTKRNP